MAVRNICAPWDTASLYKLSVWVTIFKGMKFTWSWSTCWFLLQKVRILHVVSLLLLLLFWHASLGVRITIHRHQPPQRKVLSQVDCFIQWRLWVLRSCWMLFSYVMWGCPAGLLQFSGGGAIRIILTSASLSIHALCPYIVSSKLKWQSQETLSFRFSYHFKEVHIAKWRIFI